MAVAPYITTDLASVGLTDAHSNSVYIMHIHQYMINYVSLHAQDGRTALYLASQEGHVAVVELLLQEHADVHIRPKV